MLHLVSYIYMRGWKWGKAGKMNIKARIAIFLFAIFISLFLFNAIASCCCCGSVDILKIGKRAGYEIIANVLAEEALMIASFNMPPN